MAKIVDKTVSLSLFDFNGNEYNLLRAFKNQAKREGWKKDEIELVVKEAMKNDYDHLVSTLDDHCIKQ